MTLPLAPPLAPMLARLAHDLPPGDDHVYEPKWDGFRCLVFRDGETVDLRSRNNRPLARYFPEVVEGVLALPQDRLVLDGELLVAGASGLDFTALLARLHPAASRVQRLRAETPASLVVFDVLALGDEVLCDRPFAARRETLADVLPVDRPPVFRTVSTDRRGAATAWLDRLGGGIDGVVAKHRALRYEPGRRAMVKVKRERTADCVVAGFRHHAGDGAVGSLLLGLYDAGGTLRHVGVAAGFSASRRRELLDELRVAAAPVAGHPWEHG